MQFLNAHLINSLPVYMISACLRGRKNHRNVTKTWHFFKYVVDIKELKQKVVSELIRHIVK